MNQLDFKGKTAVVTGGMQGIGAAIVKQLESSGAKVAIWDLDGPGKAEIRVLVNCVPPAAAQTAILDQVTPEFAKFMLSKIPMGRFVKVDEIAALACWLASEDCSFSTGGVFDISGGRATY